MTPRGLFLAPDNGVLSRVLSDYLYDPSEDVGEIDVPAGIAAYRLTNPRYWLHPVSQTFHGRDVFAPTAAHLSLGVPPGDLGEPVSRMCWLSSPRPVRRHNVIQAQIVNVDHFGNLATNVSAVMLEGLSGVDLKIRGRVIQGLSRTFHGGPESPKDGLVALVGSHGYLEAAVRDGSAALLLGADIGDPVEVTLNP